jgi:hypothetical protein
MRETREGIKKAKREEFTHSLQSSGQQEISDEGRTEESKNGEMQRRVASKPAIGKAVVGSLQDFERGQAVNRPIEIIRKPPGNTHAVEHEA